MFFIIDSKIIHSTAMMKKETATRLTLILLLISLNILFLLAGLWPCNFFPPNKVHRNLSNEKEFLHFEKPSIAYINPPIVLSTDSATRIILKIKAVQHSTNTLNRILTIQHKQLELLSICQWKSTIVIRITAENGCRKECSFKNIFHTDSMVSLTLFTRNSEISVNCNNNTIRTLQLIPPFQTQPIRGIVTLGNTAAGDHPWDGYVYHLSITEIEKENIEKKIFSFPEMIPIVHNSNKSVKNHSLITPVRFSPVIRRILTPPWKDYRSDAHYLLDLFLNLTGFIPSGMIMALLFKRIGFNLNKALLFSIMVGFLVSISIELLQTQLPSRTSQLSDLLLNVTGSFLGTLIPHISNMHFYKKAFSVTRKTAA